MYIAIITNSDESKQNCVVMNIRSNLRMLYANLRRLKIDIRLCSTQQWRKSAPPILSTSHCEFNGARSCAHARKTIPLTPIHPFTKQLVPSMHQESFTRSLLRSFSPVLCVGLIKGFLPSITFLRTHCFLLLCLFVSFIFIAHFFVGLCEPRMLFSFCAFTCMSNNSLIS